MAKRKPKLQSTSGISPKPGGRVGGSALPVKSNGVVRVHCRLKPDELPSKAGSAASPSIFIPQAASLGTRQAAEAILKDMDVRVVNSTPLSITIEATPKQFEHLFGAKVVSDVPAKMRRPAEYQFPRQRFRVVGRPRVPAPLQPLVDEIALPGPAVTLE